ncbi:hypothetical protein E3U36_09945 [Arsenophonus endosymbiont of Aphis craccivora]|uniref:hypothetical protein n=1 Tax=Arsenophonus endosymbiont of Aphis craccivora TaxID=1231049 RepID=UPI0015DD2F38|nr:hypothetical protein [Arsenophonus endosymbiont of Aphis craccivora]QLK88302.1 hypothetical protein E3U36_09945 [Arsenophonus endosymbiont of Aphis craccivora]
MPWGPDVETNLAISSANHLKVRFIQQSHNTAKDEEITIELIYCFIFCKIKTLLIMIVTKIINGCR